MPFFTSFSHYSCSTDLSTASQWYYSQSDFQKICGTRTASYMLLGVGRRYYQYPSHKMQKNL